MNKPGASKTGAFRSATGNSFTRALQEIGGTTVTQASNIPGQMVNDAMNAIFGTNLTTPESSSEQKNQPQSFADALKQTNSQTTEKSPLLEQQRQETELEKQRAVRHKEMQMTEVFNVREEKDKQIIKQLQEQLRLLAKEVKNLDKSTQTAIHQDVVDPGTYHVHFFQQLLNFVIMMRKRVQEANTWIENFHSRGKKKGAFWSQVYNKGGGTAYMMSQEHQIARNVG